MKKVLFFKSLVLIYGIALTSCSYQNSEAKCASLSKSKCPILKDFVVFDSDHTVNFNHRCSKLESAGDKNRWQSYAFFEDREAPVLVLANLVIGWIDFNKTKGVGLRMEEIGIKNFPDWAGDRLALALEMKNVQTGHVITGNWFETFDNNLLGKKGDKEVEYRVSKEGKFIWSHKSGYYSSVHINSENIDPLNSAYSINLLVKNLNKNQVLKLKGPMIEELEFRLNIERPVAKTLGFFDTINPFEEGGVWGWFKFASNYGDCHLVRKKAKKDFLTRFNEK